MIKTLTIENIKKQMMVRRDLLKNFGFAFSQNAVQKILGIANIYILVRLLDQAAFGEYQFILSVLGVLAIFNLPGMNNAVMQSVARGFERTFLLAIKPVLLASIAGSIIFLAIAGWYHYQQSNEHALAFSIIGIFFPLSHGLTQWRALKTGNENFSFIFIIELLSGVLITASLFCLYHFNLDDIFYPLFVILTVPAIRNIILTIATARSISHDSKAEDSSITYGLNTTFYSMLTLLANHIDKLLIYGFLSPIAVATYYAAERISQLCKTVAQDLAIVMAPRFSKMRSYTDKLEKVILIISAILATAIVIFAFTLLPPILTLIFSDAYAASIPYAQALLCSLILGNYAALIHRFLHSHLDKKNYKNVAISVAFIRILSSTILIYIFGIWGAVASNFIFRIATVILVSRALKKDYADTSSP